LNERPPVDVVIPFAGSAGELWPLVGRAAQLVHGPHDTIVVVDNRGRQNRVASAPGGTVVGVVPAPELHSSYHARNRGAAAGHAPWLLFLDADVEWPANLIDAYFDDEPREYVAVLAGGIADAALASGQRATPAERYAAETQPMAQINTIGAARHPPYAQTANCMVRRAAFEAIGAFAEGIRSGGDADLCFRLQADGWTVESRPGAEVVHRHRHTLGALLAQKARHGAGAAWLERRYPGTFPRRRWTGLTAWSARSILAAGRGRPGALTRAIVDVLSVWAFELGRLLPNQARPRRPNRGPRRPRRPNRRPRRPNRTRPPR
jgi:hypothetical protein